MLMFTSTFVAMLGIGSFPSFVEDMKVGNNMFESKQIYFFTRVPDYYFQCRYFIKKGLVDTMGPLDL